MTTPRIGERQWVTIGMFALTVGMLWMAHDNPKLWEVKLFEVILQAVVLTGLLNMVAAFHFSSNKGSEVSRENTGKAFEAITATATGHAPPTGPSGTQDDPLHVAGAEAGSPPVAVEEASK